MRRIRRALLSVASTVVIGFTVAAFGPPDPVTQFRYAGVVTTTTPVVYWAIGRAEARRVRTGAA